jgi:hypothetical protein
MTKEVISSKPSFFEKWVIRPIFNTAEKLAAGAINLIRSGVKSMVNKVLDLSIPVKKSSK